MSAKVERLIDVPVCELGEGPIWNPEDESLLLVDLPSTAGHLIKYSRKTKSSIKQTLGKHISFIIPIKNRKDEFIIGSHLELLHIKWDTKLNKILEEKLLAKFTEELAGSTVNDAKCDSKGRLWVGTYGEGFADGAGNLYSFTSSTGLVKQVPNISLSNGLDWSPDLKKFYHIDSKKGTVSEYDFDVEKGSVKFVKVLVDFKRDNVPGMPDGMTVDTDGKLWVASFGGSRVIQFDQKSGKTLQTIELEGSSQVTSLAFGGPQMDELYVVTGNMTIKDQSGIPNTPNGPNAGSTYRITGTGARGIPDDKFNIDL